MIDALFKFPKLPEDVARIIKISEQSEADGPEKKSSVPSQQSSLDKNAFRGKRRKKLGSRPRPKDQSGGGSSIKEDH
jgi:hypothetical protein